jgi:hypothetical protein
VRSSLSKRFGGQQKSSLSWRLNTAKKSIDALVGIIAATVASGGDVALIDQTLRSQS